MHDDVREKLIKMHGTKGNQLITGLTGNGEKKKKEMEKQAVCVTQKTDFQCNW